VLAGLAGCAAAFSAIAVDVTHGGPLARSDDDVARWAAGRPPDLRSWASRLTHLGDSVVIAVLIALVVVYLLARGRRFDAVLLCATGASAGLLTTVLKLAFQRSRPPFADPAARLHSFSFPSGHASGAFAVYVLVALLLTAHRGRRRRGATVAGALLLAVFVGATRVIIPVHYLSDVIAGATVGIAAVSAAWWARAAASR
jgi:undecaprenyl-diphosphatase